MSPTRHLRMTFVALHMRDEVAAMTIQVALACSTDGAFGIAFALGDCPECHKVP